MSGSKARQLRKTIGYDANSPNPILKSLYRKVKKEYTKATTEEKRDFIVNLKKRV